MVLRIMNENLYFIANKGCDATTYGLVRIKDEEFPRFKEMIENLNKNSYYGCMPVISAYKIKMDDLKEYIENPKLEPWDDDYVGKENIFYLDDKTYTFREKYFSYYYSLECVIGD